MRRMRKEITHNRNPLSASICYPGRVCMHVLDHIMIIYICDQKEKSSVQVEIKFNSNFEAKKRMYMHSVVFQGYI